MKRKVLGVLFTAMCLCAVPSAAYAEAQEAETTEAAGEAADEPEAGAETVTELSDSLYDFQVKIGDKVYQFPMYYQDFAADWTLGKNEDPEMGVGTNSYGSISFYKGDDRVSVDVINLGINQLPLNQCLVAGIDIDAIISSQLLINIFEKNTPLHDGAVIVRGDRVVSATCYLPLSDSMTLSKDLGTRHRAAVGISEVSDSLTIVVSEETGKVSIAMRGQIYRNVNADFLRGKLKYLQNRNQQVTKLRLLKRRFMNGKKDSKNLGE